MIKIRTTQLFVTLSQQQKCHGAKQRAVRLASHPRRINFHSSIERRRVDSPEFSRERLYPQASRHLRQTKEPTKLAVDHGFNIFLTESVSVAVSLEVRNKSKDTGSEPAASGERDDPAIGPRQIGTVKYSVENAASSLSALGGAGITRISSIGSSIISAAFMCYIGPFISTISADKRGGSPDS